MSPLVIIAMANSDLTTSEVIETITNAVNSVEAEASDLAGGVRVVVPDQDVGRVFGLLRREGYDYDSKRDPSGENVTFLIDAEQEPEGLGQLFS